MADIRIYDEPISEKTIVVPAKVERPSFRVIVPTPMTKIGDVMVVTTTINGVSVMEPIKFIVDSAPSAGMDIVAVVSLGLAEQPSAPLPTIEKQTEDLWVCKSPEDKAAILDPKPVEKIKG